MRSLLFRSLCLAFLSLSAYSLPTSVFDSDSRTVSLSLFQELEELSRIVDISYCVGSTGIQKPFQCLSRCSDFVGFELVTTWNTGPLLSDSCGYVALSHPPFEKRIILAFRGTYSITNTVVDLSTNPAEYVPFPGDENSTSLCTSSATDTEHASTSSSFSTNQALLGPFSKRDDRHNEPECQDCTVHAGFLTSWTNTRCLLIPHLEQLIFAYPDYKLTLVGHSLGGAVAAIASLEFQARGWNPHVTTFGEPRIGNQALNEYIDQRLGIPTDTLGESSSRYRRVTHVNDPVPLLPLEEWGYRMHAGEIYISKADLSPDVNDLEHCIGDEDPRCIAGASTPSSSSPATAKARHPISDLQRQRQQLLHTARATAKSNSNAKDSMSASLPARQLGLWPISPRYRLWELFFAHRDYFWRLGLCVPGGDPKDWWRRYPEGEGEAEPRLEEKEKGEDPQAQGGRNDL